jgi:hypothetical protein
MPLKAGGALAAGSYKMKISFIILPLIH